MNNPLSQISEGLLYFPSLSLQVKQSLRKSKNCIFMQGGGVPPLQLVETAALEEMQSRLSVREEDRPPTPSHLTTLRVKTRDGEQVYNACRAVVPALTQIQFLLLDICSENDEQRNYW